MKILQLTNKVPYPPSDGGVIAVLSLAVGLADLGHEVTVLSMTTLKHSFDVKEIPAEFSNKINFKSVKVPAKISSLGLLQNFIFSSQPYTATRFFSEAYAKKLIRLLNKNEVDIIQLEGLYLAPYVALIRQYSSAPIVMRAHNVEHEIWERVKDNTDNKLKKLYLRNLNRKLKKFEISYLNEYDFLLPITDRDGERFKALGYKKETYTLATGIDANRYQFDLSQCEYPTIFHLGSLDWEPNIEGLKWFLADVWPSISQQHPEVKFYVAGRNASESIVRFLSSFPNVIYDGEIEDANAYINSKAIMIVPLLSGGGMRIKIIEGLALAKAIVTTEIGVEGISAKDNQDIMIAKNSQEFIDKTLLLLQDEKKYRAMASQARSYILNQFDNKKIVQGLVAQYEKLRSESLNKKL